MVEKIQHLSLLQDVEYTTTSKDVMYISDDSNIEAVKESTAADDELEGWMWCYPSECSMFQK